MKLKETGGVTVTYHRNGGQVVISGKKTGGGRAIVEWHLIAGLSTHIQEVDTYDMYRITGMTRSTPNKTNKEPAMASKKGKKQTVTKPKEPKSAGVDPTEQDQGKTKN